MSNNNGWCFSFDNCSFNSGVFKTQAIALDEAQREGERRSKEGGHNPFVYLAKADLAANERFYPDADVLIEHMACQADDVGGDYVDNYPDCNIDAKNELTSELYSLLNRWCIKHGISPSFYEVGESTKYSLENQSLED